MFQGYIAQGATQQAESNEQMRRDLADQLALYARENPTATRDELRNYADSLTRKNYLMPGNAQGAAFDAMVRRADEASRSANAEAFRRFREANPDLSADEYMARAQEMFTDPLRTPFNATQQSIQSFIDDRTEAERQADIQRRTSLATYTGTIQSALEAQALERFGRLGSSTDVADLLTLPPAYAGDPEAEALFDKYKRDLASGAYDETLMNHYITQATPLIENALNNGSTWESTRESLPIPLRDNQMFRDMFNRKAAERAAARAATTATQRSSITSAITQDIKNGTPFEIVMQGADYQALLGLMPQDQAENVVARAVAQYQLDDTDSIFRQGISGGHDFSTIQELLPEPLANNAEFQRVYNEQLGRGQTATATAAIPTLAQYKTSEEIFAMYPEQASNPVFRATVQNAVDQVNEATRAENAALYQSVVALGTELQTSPRPAELLANHPTLTRARTLLGEDVAQEALRAGGWSGYYDVRAGQTEQLAAGIGTTLEASNERFTAIVSALLGGEDANPTLRSAAETLARTYLIPENKAAAVATSLNAIRNPDQKGLETIVNMVAGMNELQPAGQFAAEQIADADIPQTPEVFTDFRSRILTEADDVVGEVRELRGQFETQLQTPQTSFGTKAAYESALAGVISDVNEAIASIDRAIDDVSDASRFFPNSYSIAQQANTTARLQQRRENLVNELMALRQITATVDPSSMFPERNHRTFQEDVDLSAATQQPL